MFLQDTWEYLKSIIKIQQPIGAASNLEYVKLVEVPSISSPHNPEEILEESREDYEEKHELSSYWMDNHFYY